MSAVHSLTGIVLAVKGTEFALFRNKQEVEDFARDAGAKVMKNLSKSVTHMVVANGTATVSTGKGGCIVVDESWLRSNVLTSTQPSWLLAAVQQQPSTAAAAAAAATAQSTQARQQEKLFRAMPPELQQVSHFCFVTFSMF